MHYLSRMVVNVTQYMIRKEMNGRRFQNLHQSVHELFSQIKMIVYIRRLQSKKLNNLMLSL